MNRVARRAMARCKHEIATKTDGTGTPYLQVCSRGCGYERLIDPPGEATP